MHLSFNFWQFLFLSFFLYTTQKNQNDELNADEFQIVRLENTGIEIMGKQKATGEFSLLSRFWMKFIQKIKKFTQFRTLVSERWQ